MSLAHGFACKQLNAQAKTETQTDSLKDTRTQTEKNTHRGG